MQTWGNIRTPYRRPQQQKWQPIGHCATLTMVFSVMGLSRVCSVKSVLYLLPRTSFDIRQAPRNPEEEFRGLENALMDGLMDYQLWITCTNFFLYQKTNTPMQKQHNGVTTKLLASKSKVGFKMGCVSFSGLQQWGFR